LEALNVNTYLILCALIEMHFVHFGSREAMRDPRLRLIARRDP